MMKTFLLNYKRALFYHEVYPLLETILHERFPTISALNFESIRLICTRLAINTILKYGNEPFQLLEEEIKSNPYPDCDRKTQRIIAKCRREGATTYTNAIGGEALYNRHLFAKYGIRLQFVKLLPVCYDQRSKIFIPDLSILDVLFHNGFEKTQELLTHYEIV